MQKKVARRDASSQLFLIKNMLRRADWRGTSLQNLNITKENEEMKMYMAQKAQQALEELAKDEPFETRIVSAALHLNFVSGDHYTKESTPEIENEFKEMRAALDKRDFNQVALNLRMLIESIFEEAGRLGKLG